jgi:hypothetical protein
MLGSGAMWSSLPGGKGERAMQRKAACEAQCQTDGSCGFWNAAACVRRCADPRLACQADLAPDACWTKMVAFRTCQGALSCADLNQFYFKASAGNRPCEAEATAAEAECGYLELVASEQCYGPSLACPDGKTVSPYWVCDGDNDCNDGADEGNCPWLSSGPQSTCAPSIRIDATDTAGDLAKLAGATCVDGTLDINGSTLTDLSGLSGVTTVAGELRIGGNSALTSLHGLENLKGVQAVRIEGNPLLTDVSALAGLTFVSGDLEVSNTKALASLEGLHNISSAADVDISSNTALTSLNGLRGLKTVDGFTLSGNPLIKDFEGMGALQYFGPTGFSVNNNDALVDFTGLKVTSVGANFSVANNDALTSMKGLETVKRLAWTVSILRNPLLVSISGLSAVTEIRSDVTVGENPMLPSCQIDAWLTPLGKTCTCSGNDDATTCP